MLLFRWKSLKNLSILSCCVYLHISHLGQLQSQLLQFIINRNDLNRLLRLFHFCVAVEQFTHSTAIYYYIYSKWPTKSGYFIFLILSLNLCVKLYNCSFDDTFYDVSYSRFFGGCLVLHSNICWFMPSALPSLIKTSLAKFHNSCLNGTHLFLIDLI
jgi:hypothetical protein